MAQRETIEANGAPEAAGPYSHATVHNGVLYCAGQVPIDPETGKLVEDGAGRPDDPLPGEPRGRLRGGRDEPRPGR